MVETDELKLNEELLRPKAGLKGYLFLAFGIVLFSGMFAQADGVLKILDFTNLLGEFGRVVKDAAPGFRGRGGTGAREGFVFAFTALPAVGLALGLISVIEGQGGLKAAQRMLTPILRPLLGLPGWCGLALIGSLQNTDTGAVLTAQLAQEGKINEGELAVFSAFLYSGSALISIYYTVGVLLFQYFPPDVPIILPFLVAFAGKIFGTNLMRLYVKFIQRRESGNGSVS